MDHAGHNLRGGGERAIIDIGSNTVRLVIYGGSARAPVVLYNEKVTARLGKGVAENGRLGGRGMASALAALRRFATLLQLRGVGDVQTVATAAARDATNGAAFLDKVRALGLSPRLLSGEEEAETSAAGVMAAFPGACGVVGDLGGGSLELIDVDGDSVRHGTSLPLGTLRLPALRAGGPDGFSRRVRKMLAAADWRTAHGQPLYLVGGSLRALARFAMLQADWPIDDPHGFALAPAEALRLARMLASTKAGVGKPAAAGKPPRHALAEGMRLSSSRMASLPDAAALLAVLVRELKPSRLVFSAWGLREGLLAGRMSAAERCADPLLAGVGAFADTQIPGISLAAAKVAAWTRPACAGAQAEEGLRLAAVMLALASVRIEPNLRAEQAANWGLRKRWIGISDEGRAMLAMAVLANSGRTALPADLLRLASPARLREAMGWGLATRLCRRFTGAGTEALAASSLVLEEGRLVLQVTGDLSALYSEVVEKDLRLVAEGLGLAGEFRCVEQLVCPTA